MFALAFLYLFLLIFVRENRPYPDFDVFLTSYCNIDEISQKFLFHFAGLELLERTLEFNLL